ncbi:MAG: endonuclease/exonuclease/phosphatase family protein [Tenuifilaceae bacterium]|nr:endonuclease/exonuclease/phosphatase family protein [Tenuifilaceae bacterium]
MRRFLHSILVLTNLVFALGLLLSYLSVYISPEKFWLIALVGLAYPFLLIINIFFLAYWIFRWKIEFLIPLVAILLGIAHLSSFFQFPFGKSDLDKDSKSTQVKVISYNVNLFRLYSWSNKPATHKDVVNYVKQEKADIVCFQEFYITNDKFSQADAKKAMGMNAHIDYIVKRKTNGYGIATFSRYPIINRGDIKFENTANSCIYTDIKVGKDTIRVYNIHLQSLRLKERNLKFLLNNQAAKNKNQTMDEIKDISFKLRDAFIKRAQQVDLVSNHMAKCKHPIIVCGDFNDSPVSYSYKKMRRGLNDSFIQAGVGIASTYSGLMPSYRIDYVLNSDALNAVKFNSPKLEYSDHYPVVVTFSKK